MSSPASAILDCDFRRSQNLTFTSDICRLLDNKHEFTKFCKKLGMNSEFLLPSVVCYNNEDVLALNKKLENSGDCFVLKNLEYDAIHRLDLFTLPKPENELLEYLQKISKDGNPITPDSPWQAQRYVDIETEICTTVTVKNNQLKLISSTKSSPSQLRYHYMDIPFAKKWVLEFCEKLEAANEEFSGQFCLDFLKCRKTKKFYPIECNPRIHSLTCVYNCLQDQLAYASAALGDEVENLEPQKSNYYFGWLAYELMSKIPLVKDLYSIKFMDAKDVRGMIFKDADFDSEDVMPFFGRNIFQPLVLLWHTFLSGNDWVKYDFCIGKVVEMNGI